MYGKFSVCCPYLKSKIRLNTIHFGNLYGEKMETLVENKVIIGRP